MLHKPQSIFEAARAVLEGSESHVKEILAEGKAEASASKVSAAAGEVEDALKSANKCLDKLIDAVNKAQEHYEDANGILPAEFKVKVKEFNTKLSQLGGEIIEDAEEPAEEEEEELEAQIDPDSLEDEDEEEEDADINEDYIEVMDPSLLHKAKQNILTAWKQWRRGPETERQDIKPAAAELKKDLTDWMKNNIK